MKPGTKRTTKKPISKTNAKVSTRRKTIKKPMLPKSAKPKVAMVKVPASLPFAHEEQMIFDGLMMDARSLDMSIRIVKQHMHEVSPLDQVEMTEIIENALLTDATTRRALSYLCVNAFIEQTHHPRKWSPLFQRHSLRTRIKLAYYHAKDVARTSLRTVRQFMSTRMKAWFGARG